MHLRRGRLLALNVAVLVAFSAVTVDALTRSGRVPAQGTLAKAVQQQEKDAARSAAAGQSGVAGARTSVIAGADASGRRLIAPGVVVSGRDKTRAQRRTTGQGKQKVRRTPAKGTPGTFAESPLDMTVAYPAVSTMVAINTGLGLREAPGDTASQARAVAQWVNSNGGISGHPVRLRLLTYDLAEGTGFSAAFAPACAAAATGHRPLAVLAPLQDAETQSECLGSHNLLLVGDGPAAGDGEVYDRAGDSLFAPGSMALDRVAREETSYLADKGFLTRGSRVGIVRIHGPAFARASRETLRPGGRGGR